MYNEALKRIGMKVKPPLILVTVGYRECVLIDCLTEHIRPSNRVSRLNVD